MLDMITTSSIPQLDILLNRIGAKLQISTTAYNLADDRYRSVSRWLNDEKSPLKIYRPRIYPQGSLNIGTTTKPVGKAEYDLDFVCEFQIKPEDCLDPLMMLDLIEQRLESSEIYSPMLKRMNRCMRLNYANEFHMDILPACPNPKEGSFGMTCVLVPDSNLQCLKDSNPLGYAAWFTQIGNQAIMSFKRKSVKPLPEQQIYEDLNTLQRVVQLMKRCRDILLAHLKEKERPISIVLTTLAAKHYTGNSSVTVALMEILDAIILEISQTEGCLVVKNPTNEQEDLSERWVNRSELYKTFVDWIYDFRLKLKELVDVRGIHRVEEKMKAMFGENVAGKVISEYSESLGEQRQNGTLGVTKGTGIIVPATVVTSSVVPIRSNTFDGRDE